MKIIIPEEQRGPKMTANQGLTEEEVHTVFKKITFKMGANSAIKEVWDMSPLKLWEETGGMADLVELERI